MTLNLRSKQQLQDSLAQDRDTEVPLVDAVQGRSSGRFFYVFSAVIHIAAAVALSCTWMVGTMATNKSASAASPPKEKPAVARMAIDVGPIKFCEMNIETLVGRPQSQPGH
jgi:hypothetical protein